MDELGRISAGLQGLAEGAQAAQHARAPALAEQRLLTRDESLGNVDQFVPSAKAPAYMRFVSPTSEQKNPHLERLHLLSDEQSSSAALHTKLTNAILGLRQQIQDAPGGQKQSLVDELDAKTSQRAQLAQVMEQRDKDILEAGQSAAALEDEAAATRTVETSPEPGPAKRGGLSAEQVVAMGKARAAGAGATTQNASKTGAPEQMLASFQGRLKSLERANTPVTSAQSKELKSELADLLQKIDDLEEENPNPGQPLSAAQVKSNLSRVSKLQDKIPELRNRLSNLGIRVR